MNENHRHQVKRSVRVRRSIPDFDAVNPASLDQDSFPEQDFQVDHQQDLSQFSMSDHVGNLFRSHKSAKSAPKSNDRALQGDRPVNFGKEENDALLSSDEQYECYRQQNIEPPLSNEDPRSRIKWAKGQGPREMPIMDVLQEPRRASVNLDVAQGPRLSYVPFVRSEILKDSGKRYEQKDNNLEVNSLYSNPVQQYNLKVVKQQPNKKLPSEYFLLKDRKVPVPTNVHANFPIYDDDVDFDPDPLQGILDERYWIDSREYVPVVKTNIDEPADQRDASNYAHHQKRSVSEKSDKKKQYNECYKSSKEADNPRKEIESCNECSKGKAAKKQNNTESSDDGISYGRKLLSSVDYQNIQDDIGKNGCLADKSDDYEVDEDEEQSQWKSDGLYKSRKLLSLENQDSYDHNSPVEDETRIFPKYSSRNLLSYSDDCFDNNNDAHMMQIKSKHARNLLWYSDYDEDDESYNDEDENLQENSEIVHDPAVGYDLHSLETNNQNLNYYDRPVYETSSLQVNMNSPQQQKAKNANNKDVKTNDDVKAKEEVPRKVTEVIDLNEPEHKRHLYERIKYVNKIDPNIKVRLDEHFNKNYNIQTNPVSSLHTNLDNSNHEELNTELKLSSIKELKPLSEHMISANSIVKGIAYSKLPKYYVSNKIGDLLQKPQQEKPNGPKKYEQVDANKEFQIMRNETYKNASMGFTTANPNMRVGEKSLYKRGNSFMPQKNRRSFIDDSIIKSNPLLGDPQLLQGPGQPAGMSNKEGSKLQTSTQPLSSDSSTTDKSTLLLQNPTTESSNKTSHNTSQAKINDEESQDSKIANDIVESVIAESEKSSALGHNLGVCRRNESLMNIKFGKIIPETEKVIKFVTNCIMDKIKDHLAKQSCILLDEELIEFLKWLVLGGESYKEYEQKLGPKFFDFVPSSTEEYTTCGSPTIPSCDQPGESLPPNPVLAQQALASQQSSRDAIRNPKFSFKE